jgi:hypothetical protein
MRGDVRNSSASGANALMSWLDNYQKLKEGIEAICELNHDLLRPTGRTSKRGRKPRD